MATNQASETTPSKGFRSLDNVFLRYLELKKKPPNAPPATTPLATTPHPQQVLVLQRPQLYVVATQFDGLIQ